MSIASRVADALAPKKKALSPAELAHEKEIGAALDREREAMRAVEEVNQKIAAQRELVERLDREAVAAYGLDNFDEVFAKLNAAKSELERLPFALRAAKERLDEASRARHAIALADVTRQFKRLTDAVSGSAKELEAAVLTLQTAWTKFFRDYQKLHGALPPNVDKRGMPGGSRLKQLLTFEMFRVSGGQGSGKPMLPGAHSNTLNVHDTTRIEPFVAEIERAMQHVLTMIALPPGGKVVAAPVAPVTSAPSPAVEDRRVVDPATGVEIIGGAHLLTPKKG